MKRILTCLAILLLFVSGIVVGVMGSAAYLHHKLSALHDGPAGIHRLGRQIIDWNLDLTPEQENEIDRIMHDVHMQFFAFSSEHHEELHAILISGLDRVDAVLDERQREKWGRMRRAVDRHMEQLADGPPVGGHGH